MLSGNEIAILIKARDEASGTMDRVQGKAGKLGGVLGKVLAAGAVAGGAALVGVGVASLKMGMDFEKAMAEVKTLLPDLEKEGFNKLRDSVLDLSSEMGIATDKMVPALYQAISAGIPEENVIDFLRTGAKASIGGVTDLETAVDGLTTVVNAFGLEASETGRVADIMFTGVKLGKTTMEELSTSMFQAAPIAAALGLDIEDVVAATATLTKSGTPTSVAMTQIRQSMVSLSKPNADMIALLEQTGYASGEALLQAEGLAGALDILAEAAEGDKEAMAKAFGSVEALQAVLGLTGENAELAAQDLALVTASAGAADEAFKTMAETSSYKLNKAINQVKVGLTKVAIEVLPVLIKGFEKASSFLQQNVIPVLKEFWQEHGEGIKRFLGDTASLLRSLLVPALDTLRDAWAGIAPVLEQHVLPLLKKVGAFLLDHKPLLIAIAAVILTLVSPWLAVAAAIVIVLAKWDEISQFFTVDIPGAIDAFLTKIKELPIIGEIFEGAFEEARIAVETILALIKTNVETAINAIKSIIQIATALIHGDFDKAWNEIKNLVTGIWIGIYNNIVIVLDAIKQIIWTRITLLKDVVEDAWGLVETFFKETIPNWFKTNWKDILLGVFGGIPILLMWKFRDKLVDAIIEVSSSLKQKGESIAGWIKEGVEILPGKVKQIAIDTVNAFWEGLKSMKDWLIEQVEGFFGSIADAAKGALGDLLPGSPSKLGLAVGAGFAEGIQKGLSDNLGLVTGAVSQIGGGMAYAPVGAAAGVSGGSVHHHYHNEFSGPLLGDQRQLEEIAERLEPVLRRRLG